jgi:5-(carboxyamino)imidazole ribonucleotide synthase
MKTIGILGGGQLAKMLAIAAASLGFKTHIYCPESDSPAFDVATAYTQKAYDDFEALKQFAASVDIVTYEFENIPLKTVKALTNHIAVYPSWQSLQIAQHRIREKQFMKQLEINVTPFEEIHDLQQLQDAFARLETDCLLKTVEMGYDGKGQWWIDSNSNLEAIWQTFGSNVGILEAFVPFQKELSVIIARNDKGQCAAFPVVENIHKDGILIETIAPARIDADVSNAALDSATLIAEALQIVGVIAVEFFYTDEGELLVNEIAPHPHNSGHWTLDGCYTSQFEQCIRAITGLPFGDPSLHTAIRMVNLIGDGILDAPRYFSNPLAKVHLYGKQAIRPGRKMGHVNFLVGAESRKISV